ncbi:MAG TPA: DMT family transporter [Micromonosporaceae bacterium]
MFRVAILALLWGSSFLWIKIALRGFPPIQITAVRLAIGAAVLAAWLYLAHGRLPHGLMVWLHLAVAATVANVLPYLLFAFGEQQVDSNVAGMLNATTPVWTALLAVLVKQEPKPSSWKVAGLALGITGTLLIFAPWQIGSQFWTLGAAACLVAAASYAVSYVYMARFLAPRGMSALELSAAQLVAATLIGALATPFLGGWQAPVWRLDALASLTVLGISTGLAYVINYRLIQEDGATTASVVIYLLPVVAILLGAVVLGEIPALNSVVGVAVVLTGVALTRRRTHSIAVRPTARPPQ